MPGKSATATEAALLAAAREGDEDAFRRLVESHQGEIHALCYRMLGSPHDAEDALQDVLVRAWRALPRFDGRSALRTWMHRIAINVCLDELARRPKRLLPIDYGPPSTGGEGDTASALDPSLWIEPYPDELLELPDDVANPGSRYEQREAVELSFIAALQHLPPRQRAALVLRDVLGFPAQEVAEMLGVSRVSVNSALQRARKSIEERPPKPSQQENLRRIGGARLQTLVSTLIGAFERGNVAAIVALLAEDVVFSMPPYAAWCQGREDVLNSWLMPSDRPTGLRFLATRASGQLALGVYKADDRADRYVPIAIEVLGLRGELVAEVTSFRDPGLIRVFGLPEALPR